MKVCKMFKVLILVCSINIPPQDCRPQTAVDVITGPIVSNELSCGLTGQAYLANTALRPTKWEYVKIQCTHDAHH